MTLKTTKEQRDALLIFIADPDVTVYNTVTLYNSVVRGLCHDAGQAEELEKEAARLYDGWYAQTRKLQEEIADLRAKLNGAQKDAERYRIIRYMGPMPFWMDYGGSVHDADGCDGAADRALKEQEKV